MEAARPQEEMMDAVSWDTMGKILHHHIDEVEAAELIQECGYEELDRTYKGNTVNIVVVDC